MQSLAAKLMGQKPTSQPQSTSAILGQLSSQSVLPQTTIPQFRIGLWPIQSEADPETAMGVASLLAYLLERWSSIRVYRIFSRIDEDNTTWDIHASQISVDDWEPEGLDENGAIWGNYSQLDEMVELTLEAENDFLDDSEALFAQTWAAKNLSDLVNMLPAIAESIAHYLSAGLSAPILPIYNANSISDNSNLETTVKHLFRWELNIYFSLVGRGWGESEVIADFEKLSTAAGGLDPSLGGWIVANAVTRLLSPLYQPAFEYFQEYIIKLESEVKLFTSPEYLVTIAVALFRSGESVGAFYILEKAAAGNPQAVSVSLVLGELYRLSAEPGPALNAYQLAIEANIASPAIYSRYADLLLAFDAENILITSGAQRVSAQGRPFTEQFVLIDPEVTNGDDALLLEAIEAYKEALKLAPDNLDFHTKLLLNLIDLDDHNIWNEFKDIVERDSVGSFVRQAADAMYSMDDVSEGIEILSNAARTNPGRVDLFLNLALLQLQAGENDAALATLEKARKIPDIENSMRSDIDRLTLFAEDEDFEQHFAEVTDLVNANSELSDEDFEFLENAIERAPAFGDLYLILASAYERIDEQSDAIEVLLEGQNHFPDSAQLAVQLAKTLWEADQPELALECANKALQKNKNSVPLLALTGRFLFEDGQDEEARTFLARAEVLDALDPMLREVRVIVSRLMRE